jgi:methenyltetrahydrofolate cyclohydrolase
VSAPAAGISAVPFGDLLDAVASDEPTPGGGAVSAAVAALAAGLAAMAGRYALKRQPDSEAFETLVVRSDALRRQALVLADADAAAYGRYVEASRLPRQPDPGVRAAAVRAALDAAADVPLALARLAVEVAAAGEELAREGNPNLRSDACTATMLASAVADSAAILVGENLRSRRDDPRVTEAARLASEAAATAGRILTRFGHREDSQREDSHREEGQPG